MIARRAGARTRARRLSLRARLLWVFLVPLVVVLSVVGVAATTALRSELLGQVDTQLAAAVDRSARADETPHGYGGNDPGPEFLLAPGQGDGTLGARVRGRRRHRGRRHRVRGTRRGA